MTASERVRAARGALTMVQAEPFNAEAPPEALTTDITPTELHYVRSNFALPEHDGLLHVGGTVANPLTLTLDDLRALPAVTRAVTLECAGNGRLGQTPLPEGEPWGRYAVSTARWTGARLCEVLDRAGCSADGVDVRFQGADHGPYHQHEDLRFVRSLDLVHAADPSAEILIAYDMNGEPLDADHGAPFRLIVPHWYGVASVKWLERIDVITTDYAGEFQVGHYMYEWPDRPHEPVTAMRVRARITDPAPGAELPAGTCTIRGKAWSGTGPVTKVELSFTGAGDWHPARLDIRQEPYAWQDWSFEWTVSRPGRYSLRARATDAAGNVQSEVPPWNRLGYGNNAVEVQHVDIR
ncbi:molybdenum-dependent oxidoreductase-like protein [Solirubrobacter pauli]|uniref:Molybdenum-dependent oxidoreductase-like protein n=1 Tax=Solirubrobacter pauli TaxID=166793 RepID=A0A660LGI6_9ACTN|nr:sulfite oxidase [Solirubrobacter pauli]RKQ93040.1 molybdenum-dependent oxidoreductase-like protein [Solirubrobacter pauli]